MRSARVALGLVVTLVLGGALATGHARPAAADTSPTPVGGDTWTWLLSQLETGTVVTTRSLVTPDADYPASWTGPVSGSVTLDGLPPTTTPDQLQVQAVVVTDRAYPIAVAQVAADGTFSFAWSHPGTKVFRLLDPATGAVLAEHAPDLGLIRSFDVPVGHHLHGRVFSYDQALALVTAVSLGEDATADRLARGLVLLQTTGGPQDGGFLTSAAALYPEGGTPEYRTGNHALATYALLRYLRDGNPDPAARAAVVASSGRAVDWLLDQQAGPGPLAGLVLGGHGWYTGGGFDADHALPWAATEHNVDAWHTLRLASSVLGRPDASSAADVLEAAILQRLWSSTENRFWQGLSPEGPDHGHALDASSWGSIFLQAAGHQALAETALANLAWYAGTHAGATGFAPVPFPAQPIVWVEGSAGVALAQLRVGRDADAAATMAGLAPLSSGGVYPGASRDDEWLSMTSAPAVGAANWMLLAQLALAGQPSIWDPEIVTEDP